MATNCSGTMGSSERVTRSAKRRKLNTYGRNTSKLLASHLGILKNVDSAVHHLSDVETSSMDVDNGIADIQDQIRQDLTRASPEKVLQPKLSASGIDHNQRQSRMRQRRSHNTLREGSAQQQEYELPVIDNGIFSTHPTPVLAPAGRPPRRSPRDLRATSKENRRLGQQSFGNGKHRTNGQMGLSTGLGESMGQNLAEDTSLKRKPGRPRQFPGPEAKINDVGRRRSSKQEQDHTIEDPCAENSANGVAHFEPQPGLSNVLGNDDKAHSLEETATLTPSRQDARSQVETQLHSPGKSMRENLLEFSHSTSRRSSQNNRVNRLPDEQDLMEAQTFHNGKESPSARKPNSIITPTKRKKGRPKKWIKFRSQEQEDIEKQSGFDETPTGNDCVGDLARFTGSVSDHEREVEAPDFDGSLVDAARSPRSSSDQVMAGYIPRPNVNTRDKSSTTSIALPQVNDKSLPCEMANIPTHMGNSADASSLVTILKTILLEKLTRRRQIRLIGLDEECKKVRTLMEQTVVAGEGNSMIIIGARGSGKSAMVDSIVSDLAVDHENDFHVIRLNGFIHTDDKLALREIWRQLGREMEVDEDAMNKTSNYADTLSSLLALLSHPSEFAQSEADETSKSVVFIMDEFDLFVSHPRQTLLYNLFDIAQSRKAPIAVLGLTSRIDITETLEKRVKSRFSHRYVYISLPKTLSNFWAVCKEGLTISAKDLLPAFADTEGVQEEVLMSGEGYSFLESWNTMIETQLYQDPTFTHFLQSIFYRTKSVKDFFAAALIPIATLTSASVLLTGQSFVQNTLTSPESKLDILPGLGDLDLALLIAAARLDVILDTDTCNFNMAYDEYTSLASRVKVQSSASGAAAVGAGSKVWGREVAMGAWENLMDYELLVPAIGTLGGVAAVSGTGGGTGSREVGRTGKMVRVDVGLEEILPSVPGISAVMAKWCKEV
ncbi:MAG: hypothetical protein M1836_006563 [Candelina mexicana]|nr:MAG: hypothetical protein M1836_006563 [Candelina mexicana]